MRFSTITKNVTASVEGYWSKKRKCYASIPTSPFLPGWTEAATTIWTQNPYAEAGGQTDCNDSFTPGKLAHAVAGNDFCLDELEKLSENTPLDIAAENLNSSLLSFAQAIANPHYSLLEKVRCIHAALRLMQRFHFRTDLRIDYCEALARQIGRTRRKLDVLAVAESREQKVILSNLVSGLPILQSMRTVDYAWQPSRWILFQIGHYDEKVKQILRDQATELKPREMPEVLPLLQQEATLKAVLHKMVQFMHKTLDQEMIGALLRQWPLLCTQRVHEDPETGILKSQIIQLVLGKLRFSSPLKGDQRLLDQLAESWGKARSLGDSEAETCLTLHLILSAPDITRAATEIARQWERLDDLEKSQVARKTVACSRQQLEPLVDYLARNALGDMKAYPILMRYYGQLPAAMQEAFWQHLPHMLQLLRNGTDRALAAELLASQST